MDIKHLDSLFKHPPRRAPPQRMSLEGRSHRPGARAAIYGSETVEVFTMVYSGQPFLR